MDRDTRVGDISIRSGLSLAIKRTGQQIMNFVNYQTSEMKLLEGVSQPGAPSPPRCPLPLTNPSNCSPGFSAISVLWMDHSPGAHKKTRIVLRRNEVASSDKFLCNFSLAVRESTERCCIYEWRTNQPPYFTRGLRILDSAVRKFFILSRSSGLRSRSGSAAGKERSL